MNTAKFVGPFSSCILLNKNNHMIIEIDID